MKGFTNTSPARTISSSRRIADKEGAFFAIFSTLTGAVEIVRLLPGPVGDKVLGNGAIEQLTALLAEEDQHGR